MERRFRIRLEELRNDAEVPDQLLHDLLPGLQTFVEPFGAALRTAEQKTNAQHYLAGLLSDRESKDAESIA
jgi:hypothetical protein